MSALVRRKWEMHMAVFNISFNLTSCALLLPSSVFSKWTLYKLSSQIIIIIFLSRQPGEEGSMESDPTRLLKSLVLAPPTGISFLEPLPHHPQVEFLVSWITASTALMYVAFLLRQTRDSHGWTASLTARPEEHKKPVCFLLFQRYSQNRITSCSN